MLDITVHLAVAGNVFDSVFLCCPFFPRDVLDESWDLIVGWLVGCFGFNGPLRQYFSLYRGGGRVVRWLWITFQCRGVLLVWKSVGQGPTALAVGAGGGCLDIFTLIYPFSFLSPSLWETTRYRLKYCLKGSLSPKTTNQPNLYRTVSPREGEGNKK